MANDTSKTVKFTFAYGDSVKDIEAIRKVSAELADSIEIVSSINCAVKGFLSALKLVVNVKAIKALDDNALVTFHRITTETTKAVVKAEDALEGDPSKDKTEITEYKYSNSVKYFRQLSELDHKEPILSARGRKGKEKGSDSPDSAL